MMGENALEYSRQILLVSQFAWQQDQAQSPAQASTLGQEQVAQDYHHAGQVQRS